MNRKLCIDGAEMVVIATTPNGEMKAACWGQTSATLRPLPTRGETAGAIELSGIAMGTADADHATDAVLAFLKGLET